MTEYEVCYNCDGHGWVDVDTGPFQGQSGKCEKCDGTGRIPKFRPSSQEAT